MNKTLYGLIPIILILFTSCQKDELVFNNGLVRQPYLQKIGKDQVTIMWKSFYDTKSELCYGESPSHLDHCLIDSVDRKEHKYVLKDLQPDQQYYYGVKSEDNFVAKGEQFQFKTAPANDRPVRIWALGDAGTGLPLQNRVRDAYLEMSTDKPTDLWLWLGDNAYIDGSEEDFMDHVFTGHYEGLMSYLPVIPLLGNHDLRGGYLSNHAKGTSQAYFNLFETPENGEIGGIASNSKHYFSMDYSNIHFIFLDSYGSENQPGSAMYEWLQRDLEVNSKKWTIALIHHPPYSKGGHDSDSEPAILDIRKNLIPVLESYGVDMVLSGHSHAYQRSKFINGHYGMSNTFSEDMIIQHGSGKWPSPYIKNDKGTVYVVAGCGGQLEYSTKDMPHPAMEYGTVWHGGSLMIDVEGSKLTVKFITASRKVKDEFTIVKEY